MLVTFSSFMFGWLILPTGVVVWRFFSGVLWLPNLASLFDLNIVLPGAATTFTGILWWQFGRSVTSKKIISDLVIRGFLWAEANAYFCTVLWALSGNGPFETRNGPNPFPLYQALIIGLAGPLLGFMVSMFIGPLYLWMLESIVQKFEPRAPSAVRVDS
jgi:hypothetical protein